MNIKTALIFGMRSFLHSGKKNETGGHLRGAVLGISLSLIPMMVVIVLANGMIEGITLRLIEVFTSHLQVTLPENPKLAADVLPRLRSLPGVKNAHLERSGYALVKSNRGDSATTVKAVTPDLMREDAEFRKNFHLRAGAFDLEAPPAFIAESTFENKILRRLSKPEDRGLLSEAYTHNPGDTGYHIKPEILPAREAELNKILRKAKFSNLIIGEALADKLDAGLGDEVFILSVMSIHGKTAVRSTKYLITGIFSTGYQDLDKFLLYIPYARGMQTIAPGSAKDYLGIKVDDPFADLETIETAVRDVLEDNGLGYSYIQTWYEKQRLQFQSYQSTKISLIFIMCLIVLVAAVNVYSSIHMLVISKMREIAILKSMGATPATISFSFLFTGFVTGIIGTIAGISIGLLLAVNINELMAILEQLVNLLLGPLTRQLSPVLPEAGMKPFKILNPDYYLESIPIRISSLEVAAVAFFSILVATLTSYRPARNAGKVRPLEIIRKY